VEGEANSGMISNSLPPLEGGRGEGLSLGGCVGVMDMEVGMEESICWWWGEGEEYFEDLGVLEYNFCIFKVEGFRGEDSIKGFIISMKRRNITEAK